MPDPTTPEDHLNDQPVDAAQVSPRMEDTPNSDIGDGLSNTAREGVAAFRENLGTAGVRLSEQDDFAELAGRLKAHRSQVAVRPPGPGVPEAVGWMFGVLVVHIIGMVVAVFGLLILQIAEITWQGGKPAGTDFQAMVVNLPENFRTGTDGNRNARLPGLSGGRNQASPWTPNVSFTRYPLARDEPRPFDRCRFDSDFSDVRRISPVHVVCLE